MGLNNLNIKNTSSNLTKKSGFSNISNVNLNNIIGLFPGNNQARKEINFSNLHEKYRQ